MLTFCSVILKALTHFPFSCLSNNRYSVRTLEKLSIQVIDRLIFKFLPLTAIGWQSASGPTGDLTQWGESLGLGLKLTGFFCLEEKITWQGIPSTMAAVVSPERWPVTFLLYEPFSSGANPSCTGILCIFYIIQGILASDLLHLICGWFSGSTSGSVLCNFTEKYEQILGFFWNHIFTENHPCPLHIFTLENFQLSLNFLFIQWTIFHIGWTTS